MWLFISFIAWVMLGVLTMAFFTGCGDDED